MYKLKTLKNNLKLITIPTRGTKTACVLVMIGTGSKYENRKNNGISHFLEHMFFKGTKNRPTALKLSSELDGMGAEFNAFTGKEYTGYWIKSDSSKINKAMSIVSDMLFNSLFAAEEIEREKGVILEELNMYLDNPIMHIEDIFEQCLYGDTPAGWDTIGVKDSIARFKREDFIDYFRSQYAAHNTTIALAGNIKANSLQIVNKYFSNPEFFKQSADFREKPLVMENQKEPRVKIHYKKTDQAHLSLGARAFSYNHKNKIIANFISVLLGGSMSSRLFINLRERNGLAYYVRTECEAYTDSGYLTTRAGVPVDKLPQAIKIILGEYKKLKNILVSSREIRRIKDMLFGRTAIQLEASDTQANWYGRQAVLLNTIERVSGEEKNLKIMAPEEYLQKIKKISATDIKRVAQDIFVNQGLNLAVIGPFRDKEKFRKLLKL